MSSRSNLHLPDTLAQRVQFLRMAMDLTHKQLAARAKVPVELIQDIEAGIELFLSPSVRSKLARALRIRSGQLAEVERHIDPEGNLSLSERMQRREKRFILRDAVRHNPEGQFECPDCESPMVIRVFNRRDIEDKPLRSIKAHCSQCLFQFEIEENEF